MSVVGGMDITRLSRLGNWMQECVDAKKFTGASVAVFRKNNLIYESFNGVMDIENNKPITKDTVFRIY